MSENSTEQPLDRVTVWICCHCGKPRAVGVTCCYICHKRLYEIGEFVRAGKEGETQQGREQERLLIYWLLRAYQSGHREGWESGPNTDETVDGICSVLANLGYDPNLSEAAKTLLAESPKYGASPTSAEPSGVTLVDREEAAKVAENMRPSGGRMWTDEQAACFESLTDCATNIRALPAYGESKE